MIVTVVAKRIQTCSWLVGNKQAVFLYVSSFDLRPEHALVQLGLVELELVQHLQRALREDLGRATVLNEEVPSHEILEETTHRQKLQSWPFAVPAGCQKRLRHAVYHVSPEGAVGRCEEAEDAHDQDAVQDQGMIKSPRCEPPIPHVYGRQMRDVLISCPC